MAYPTYPSICFTANNIASTFFLITVTRTGGVDTIIQQMTFLHYPQDFSLGGLVSLFYNLFHN